MRKILVAIVNENATSLLMEEYLLKINAYIASVLPTTPPTTLYSPIEYFFSHSGKRIRPLLTVVSSELFSNNIEKSLQAAAAVEMLHNFTLIHDDIMDKSPLRRGAPTVHEQWDESTAILSGDAMVGLALRLLIQATDNHPRVSSLLSIFTEGYISVCEGQAYDLEFSKRDDISVADYINMITLKTARLLEMSVELGGTLSMADQKQIMALKQYARGLGIAFQLQDDFLDVVGDEQKFGKSIGQDIVEGKKTIFVLLARERAVNNEDKNLMKRFFENHGLNKEDLPQLIELFHRLHIIDDVKNNIQTNILAAEIALESLPNNIHRNVLLSILSNVTDRDK